MIICDSVRVSSIHQHPNNEIENVSQPGFKPLIILKPYNIITNNIECTFAIDQKKFLIYSEGALKEERYIKNTFLSSEQGMRWQTSSPIGYFPFHSSRSLNLILGGVNAFVDVATHVTWISAILCDEFTNTSFYKLLGTMKINCLYVGVYIT